MTSVILDRDDLTITGMRGETPVAVVCFTGIGHALGMQREEFRASLSSDGPEHAPSTLFVIDRARAWYNNGLPPRIAATVNATLEAWGCTRVVTLGNSMGGFGAIVFAGRLARCDRAIAFCPQSSVDPAIVPFDRRWPQWRAAIRRWDIRDAIAELRPGIGYHAVFGERAAIDRQHAARFAASGRVRVEVVPGCGHDVAAHLKAEGRLRPLLDRLIRDAGGGVTGDSAGACG